jgi:hypothetical protein
MHGVGLAQALRCPVGGRRIEAFTSKRAAVGLLFLFADFMACLARFLYISLIWLRTRTPS